MFRQRICASCASLVRSLTDRGWRLTCVVGRDPILIMGSEAANLVVYDLTGVASLCNAVWSGRGTNPAVRQNWSNR
jgi:hypothetical protein